MASRDLRLGPSFGTGHKLVMQVIRLIYRVYHFIRSLIKDVDLFQGRWRGRKLSLVSRQSC